MKTKSILMLLLFLQLFSFLELRAQMEQLHGDEQFLYGNVHDGNQIRTSFSNSGQLGLDYRNTLNIECEWPIYSDHFYISLLAMFIGAEVIDNNGQLRHIVSEPAGMGLEWDWHFHLNGDISPIGELWTWLPLPGFANDDQQKIAMSDMPATWPSFWPDKMDDTSEPGWPGYWNGYFGKNQFNADQESYYIMDDYHNREFDFHPDSTDFLRRGLGLRIRVRGFQWTYFELENVLFWHYNVENIGTTNHHKVVLGFYYSPPPPLSDGWDDRASYDLENDLVYSWDNDNIGGSDWPAGYMGISYLESPDNPNDGIDNDGDGINGSGLVIGADMFAPRTINEGDDFIKIHPKES